jgi:hypothetical protein
MREITALFKKVRSPDRISGRLRVQYPGQPEKQAKPRKRSGAQDRRGQIIGRISMWERGLNEHTNGQIRQYLPKKMPFDTLTQRQLDKIVDKINNRACKVLGYLTPYEVFSP